jgi:hypothetical protein
MYVETLTYATLGARLKITPEAARSLARRLRLPCLPSDDGKAVVSVDYTTYAPAATWSPGRQHRPICGKDRGIEGGDRASRSKGSR